METSWSAEEEQKITGAMAGGIGRIAAVQDLRRRWLIGETVPPGQNPRFREVRKVTQERADCPMLASLLTAEASTSDGTRVGPTAGKTSTRKAASDRQARWRAKRVLKAA